MKCKKKERQEKGITLIALVITIIVLLILVSISIATLTGENGILGKAKRAKDKMKQEEGREIIQIAINEMLIEKKENGKILTLDYIGDHIHEKLKISKDNIMKNGKPAQTVNVIYGEYEYEIDDKFQVNVLGSMQGRVTIDITYEVKGNKAIIYVTAKSEKGIKKIILPNDKEENGNNQKEKTIEYTVYNNEEYKFIAEGNDDSKRIKTIEVEGIDTNPPNEAVITIDGSPTYAGGDLTATITATVTVSDNKSGIDIEKCKYIINSSNSKIGIDSSEWENAETLKSNTSTIDILSNSIDDKYLHVLSVNKAGNKIETVSSEASFIEDNLAPNEANITLSPTRVDVGKTIIATVHVSDSQSGIDIEKSKYIINNSETKIDINDSNWVSASTLSGSSSNIPITSNARGSLYLHVLSCDRAGNKIETVSDEMYFAEVLTIFSVNDSSGSSYGRYDHWPNDWVRSDQGRLFPFISLESARLIICNQMRCLILKILIYFN